MHKGLRACFPELVVVERNGPSFRYSSLIRLSVNQAEVPRAYLISSPDSLLLNDITPYLTCSSSVCPYLLWGARMGEKKKRR